MHISFLFTIMVYICSPHLSFFLPLSLSPNTLYHSPIPFSFLVSLPSFPARSSSTFTQRWKHTWSCFLSWGKAFVFYPLSDWVLSSFHCFFFLLNHERVLGFVKCFLFVLSIEVILQLLLNCDFHALNQTCIP